MSLIPFSLLPESGAFRIIRCAGRTNVTAIVERVSTHLIRINRRDASVKRMGFSRFHTGTSLRMGYLVLYKSFPARQGSGPGQFARVSSKAKTVEFLKL